MAKVFRIGYIEFATADLPRLSNYYENVLGLQPVDATSDTAYLSLGLDHHNVSLRKNGRSGLSRIGFQVNQDIVLSEMAHDLEMAGHPVVLKKDARPGVPELIEVVAPGGIMVELFHTMSMPAPGFSERGIGPASLGHVAIMGPDTEKTVQFYVDALGFHTTDWIEGLATFMTCNSDHHVMNIIESADGKSRAHHIAFSLRDRGHHCEAADFLARTGTRTVWGPARHTAGHNFAAYHFDPDRTIMELYTDMDRYIPELGIFEARPWHEDRPQKPKVWPFNELNTWGTHFEFNFSVE